jgi:tetratricopeptide (TPR) repeat protein
MKNILLILFVTLLAYNAGIAQDASKDFKSAEKVLKKFNSDPASVTENEVANAMVSMNDALQSDKLKGDAKYFITKAKLLNSMANEEFKMSTINPEYKQVNPLAAVQAYDALMMANKIDGKKKAKDIAYAMEDAEKNLNNLAIVSYQNKDYATAYSNFKASIDAYEALTSMKKKSRLEDPALLKDQYFYAAVSAYYGEKYDDAKPMLTYLAENNAEDPFVYDALYNITKDSNQEEALAYLAKGRELNPDDTGLLFSEINHYLAAGELDKLIGKLETAIEKEPDNLSIYNTLGSVYDQLHQKAEKDGDEAKSTEYFDKALKYYGDVLAKDPSNFDANYSSGALYYNKAALYVEKLNDLANDLSSAGMKKYDSTKMEMDAEFNKALPYFIKAEELNGNDMNTLIALSEIYARLNDLEKSKQYKEKRQAVGGQ